MTTAFAGCLGDSAEEVDDSNIIRLAYTVKDDYDNPDTNPQLMANYIAEHSGYEVEIYPISSSNAAIEAVRFGHADAAFLDGGAAFVGWKSHGLEAILADTKSDGSTYYTAAAWVLNSSNITTLEQLEGNNSCHTGWLKSAGMLMPMGYMIGEGMVDVLGNPDDIESLRTTIEGHFDVATIPEKGAQYYGYGGAFECMTAGVGDVAFAKTSSYEDHCEGNEWCLDRDGYRMLEPAFGQVPTHPVMWADAERNPAKQDAFVASMLAMSSEMWVENYSLPDGQDICYNMVSHAVSGDNATNCASYMYLENHTMQDGSSFTGCYNSGTHATDGNMSQEECEAFSYYVNYGATQVTGCYSVATHQVADVAQNTCGGEILKNVLENSGAVTTVNSQDHLGSYSDAIASIPGIDAYFEDKHSS